MRNLFTLGGRKYKADSGFSQTKPPTFYYLSEPSNDLRDIDETANFQKTFIPKLFCRSSLQEGPFEKSTLGGIMTPKLHY